MYDKSISDQWRAADSLDWSQAIDPVQVGRGIGGGMLSSGLTDRLSSPQRDALMAGMGALTFSQLLHGEQGALMVSADLVRLLPSVEMKQAAASQTNDEARHLDVFTRYIRRMGEIHPPSASLRRVLEKVVAHPMWLAQLVGMQIVVEGMALATFLDMRKTTSCPLLRAMLDLVIKDEARHHAFGKIALRRHVEALEEDDRLALQTFALDLVRIFRDWGTEPEDMINSAYVMVGAGIDPTDMITAVRNSALAGNPLDMSRGMRYAFMAFILPDLEQLGLISQMEGHLIRTTLPSQEDELNALDRLREELVR
ncbi:ferritin-like domain-containing protein [Novosphingobium beihaiensis]|uniref:Ferritin-like domain-containing protein n=1 Tax=Novosphingobium beihaiensis TaxID=2930389 RepID=A0ABT0BTV0_9SPHN|nr:ferritin-like domain-containing protein [Novosphingobium beihaiensis]MCJ2188480.1 ferritin-like domain-containing protein [Novosphingobium beihaiensis]